MTYQQIIALIMIGFFIGYPVGHIMGYRKCEKDKVEPLSRVLDRLWRKIQKGKS